MRNHLKWVSLIFILASSLAAYAQDGDDSADSAQASSASSQASPQSGDKKPEGNDEGVPEMPRDN
jgi:hypothetical protein